MNKRTIRKTTSDGEVSGATDLTMSKTWGQISWESFLGGWPHRSVGIQPTPALSRGPYSLAVRKEGGPSGSLDSASHSLTKPNQKPSGKQASAVHPTDEPPGSQSWAKRNGEWIWRCQWKPSIPGHKSNTLGWVLMGVWGRGWGLEG